jgi:capsid protein
MHIPQVMTPIWQRFKSEAVIQTRARLGSEEPDWTPPRFELIDPLKETQAELEAVLAGFDTWPEVVRRRGWSSEDQLQVIEDWQKELDDRGIVLKSDPRVTVTSEPAQPPPAAT